MMIFKAIESWRAARWVAREAQEISGFGTLGFEAAVLCKQYAALAACGNVALAEASKGPYSPKSYEKAARYFKTVLVEFSKGKRGDVSDLGAFNDDIRKAALQGYWECAKVIFEANLLPDPFLFIVEHTPVADPFADEVVSKAEEKLSCMGKSTQQTLKPKIEAVKARLEAARKAGVGDKSLAEIAVEPSFAEKDQKGILEAFRNRSVREVKDTPFDHETALFIANTFLCTDAPGATEALIDVALQANGGSTAEKVLVDALEWKPFVTYALRKLEAKGNDFNVLQRTVNFVGAFDPDERWGILGQLADRLPDGSESQKTMVRAFEDVLNDMPKRKQKDCCLATLLLVRTNGGSDNSFRQSLAQRLNTPVRGQVPENKTPSRLEYP